MNWKKEKLYDTWIVLTGIPLTALICATMIYLWEPVMKGMMLKAFLAYLIIVALDWFICREVLKWSRANYPGLSGLRKRLAISFLIYLVVILPTAIANYLICNALLYYGTSFPMVYLFKIVIISIGCLLAGVGVYEVQYYFLQWARATKTSEEIKRRVLQTQLDSLKHQINPNFLFSNLDVLSSLLKQRNTSSSQFVHELSEVYHYILLSNENQLAPLIAEIEFTKTYSYILKKRFGDAFRLEVSVPEKSFDLKIPSLTLQILLENAVKHNEISAERPLTIKISTGESGSLTVSNNLQRKVQLEASDKIGLENIRKRYAMLNKDGMMVKEAGGSFIVNVPLIEIKSERN